MPTLTLEDLHASDPEKLLPVEPEFDETHRMHVSTGYAVAQRSSIAFVAICRNAMPFLPLTLGRVEVLGELFAKSSVYVYENDSTDGTKDLLTEWEQAGKNRHAVRSSNGRPHLNFTKAAERTIALAEYRNNCLDWVRSHPVTPDWVVVFDTDPWGGFSLRGVLDSIGRMSAGYDDAIGMASYSWCEWGQPVWPQPTICHYDAWACRPNYWPERHNMNWFHLWHPPVGSEPVKMNSAFGQLAVYRGRRFVSGRYSGGDCEHVPFHRSCGGPIYLNPVQRVVSFWCPSEDQDPSVHGDVHNHVAGGNVDA